MHEIPNLPFPSLHQPQPSDTQAAASQSQHLNGDKRQEPQPADGEE
jgi:hypothetical protein